MEQPAAGAVRQWGSVNTKTSVFRLVALGGHGRFQRVCCTALEGMTGPVTREGHRTVALASSTQGVAWSAPTPLAQGCPVFLPTGSPPLAHGRQLSEPTRLLADPPSCLTLTPFLRSWEDKGQSRLRPSRCLACLKYNGAWGVRAD